VSILAYFQITQVTATRRNCPNANVLLSPI